jgi:hypothetical protein
VCECGEFSPTDSERLEVVERKIDALLEFANRTTVALDAFGDRLAANPLFRALSGSKR